MILKDIEYLLDISKVYLKKDYKDIKMCELGNQLIKRYGFRVAKKYFVSLGIKEHISVDINGKDCAIRMDLSKISDKWKNYFDVVTNFGTTEHVGNQYCVFKNIHNFTSVGGVMVHSLPVVGTWENHCKFRYYKDFFKCLAEKNKYMVIDDKIVNANGLPSRALLCCAMAKIEDGEFVDEDEFCKNLIDIEG